MKMPFANRTQFLLLVAAVALAILILKHTLTAATTATGATACDIGNSFFYRLFFSFLQ